MKIEDRSEDLSSKITYFFNYFFNLAINFQTLETWNDQKSIYYIKKKLPISKV